MFKLVFVCHGNICRSPMAEAVMKALVKEKGLEKEFLIESRATSREEIIGGMGNPVHTEARAELARQGIPCPNHRATQLIKGDYLKYDLFIGMDRVNMRKVPRSKSSSTLQAAATLPTRGIPTALTLHFRTSSAAVKRFSTHFSRGRYDLSQADSRQNSRNHRTIRENMPL